ncbi:NAD(P)-binding domain-containing protein [Tardiphaga sp. 71_E8_N1_1]|uniref:NAD(P)-binding domain-containing protein n=1 Tax=Tardiphaga sp. 71_E8_N1_1 TaxID=3240784 RepID=UPI003F895793
MIQTKTVAVIGAGPVGLAAAAHILERGMTPIVLEAGPKVGHAVRQWGHVQLFSPWEYNVDPAAKRLLEATGWNSPAPGDYPTGSQLVEQYLEPMANRTQLQNHILTSSRVTEISRQGFDKLKSKGRASAPFEIRYQTSANGTQVTRADAVIDVTGTWASPNPAGANGLYAIGEKDVFDRVAYAMPDILGSDRARYAGKTVAVLGAGHSAIGTLTSLAHLKSEVPETTVIWLLRGEDPAKAFGGGANDKLAARGELGSAFAALVSAGLVQVEPGFRATHLNLEEGRLRISAGSACCGRNLKADELIVATGFRPSFDFVRELRIKLDPAIECPVALAPLIDPNEHSCGTVRPHGARELAQDEPGFYFAGMKSYGRAPTFLMLTGYEQVRSIAADIAGDHQAAERVELVLPETGVCSRTSVETTSCCGDPEPARKSSCCA